MNTREDGPNFDSAALLTKYINLQVTGNVDDLAPHSVLGLPKDGATESQVLQALRAKLQVAQSVPATSDAEVSHVRMLLHASAAVMLAQGLGISSSLESSQKASIAGSGVGQPRSVLAPSDQRPITWASMPLQNRDGGQDELIDLAAPATPVSSASVHASARKGASLPVYATGDDARTVPAKPHVQPAQSEAQPGRTPFEQELFVTLAVCGGWNAKSMHRVQMLAAARGIAPKELLRTLERATQLAATVATPAASIVSRAVPTAPQQPQMVSRPAATATSADFGAPLHRSSPISSGQSAFGLPAVNQTATVAPEVLGGQRQTFTASGTSVRPAAAAGATGVHEPIIDPFESGYDRTTSAIRAWLIGGTAGAALLIVVALTLRYTIGRTPSAIVQTAGGTAPAAPLATNGNAAPPLNAESAQAQTTGNVTNNAATGQDAASQGSVKQGFVTQASASPRTGGNRSVQELLAAINSAAVQGGIQRVPTSIQQTTDPAAKSPPIATKPLQARNLDGSLVAFRDAFEEFSQRWISSSQQQLPALSNAVLEYLYRVGDSDAHAQATLAIIAAPAQDVFGKGSSAPLSPASLRASVLSMGLLARLQAERDLSWSMRSTIDRACDEVFQSASDQVKGAASAGTLSYGASIAIRSLVPRLLAQPRTQTTDAAGLWTAWKECTGAVHPTDTLIHSTMVLGAIDTLVNSAIPPSQHPIVLAGYRSLVPALSWNNLPSQTTPGAKPHDAAGTSAASPLQRAAQSRLIAWLASPNAGSDHLSVIISSMIDAKAPGVDISMSLSASANETDRAQLRERFAALFGLDVGVEGTTDAATAALARLRELASPLQVPLASQGAQRSEVLTRLAMCSYANTIAWQLVLGDVEIAQASLGGFGVPDVITAAGKGSALFHLTVIPHSTSWGVRYVIAGSSAAMRLDALKDAATVENMLEARAALDEAMRGTSPEHRSRGRKIIESNPDNRFALAAMLDLSSNAPPAMDLRSLYERLAGEPLPAFADPAWRIALRKSMIRRVIQSIARDQDDQLRDVVAAQRFVGQAYEDRLLTFENTRRRELGQQPLVMQQRPQDPDPSTSLQAITNAVAAYSRNLYVSSGVSVTTPDSALAVLTQRLRNVKSKPQEIVAHQMAVLDMQGYIVASRAPQSAEQAAQRIAAAKIDVAKASDVLTQMQLCENAMLDVWMLAFGSTP